MIETIINPIGAGFYLQSHFWFCTLLTQNNPSFERGGKTEKLNFVYAVWLLQVLSSWVSRDLSYSQLLIINKKLGAGAGGVATAARLAKAGYQVTVVEKNEFLGGRCSLVHHEDYVRHLHR